MGPGLGDWRIVVRARPKADRAFSTGAVAGDRL